MSSRSLLLALALAAAACGGQSSSPTTPPPGGRIAGPGTVVGDQAVYDALLASTIALPAGPADMQCAGDQATLGAQVAAWAKLLGGPIAARCEGTHCTVELASPIDPACDTNPDQDGCEGSAQVIEYDLDATGAIVVATLMCMAAG